MKIRSKDYREYKVVCHQCSKELGPIVGIDPVRGHAPYDPDGRHKYFCDEHQPKAVNVKGHQEILAEIAQDYANKKLSPEQTVELLIQALINKGK